MRTPSDPFVYTFLLIFLLVLFYYIRTPPNRRSLIKIMLISLGCRILPEIFRLKFRCRPNLSRREGQSGWRRGRKRRGRHGYQCGEQQRLFFLLDDQWRRGIACPPTSRWPRGRHRRRGEHRQRGLPEAATARGHNARGKGGGRHGHDDHREHRTRPPAPPAPARSAAARESGRESRHTASR